jgi:L-rhamnose-H+ transport protein
MPGSLTGGLGVVLLAGVFQGSFLFPSKWMKGWSWENYWLVFAATAYLASPWLVAALTIPRLLDVYRGISAGALVSIGLFGTGWGLGALTFGLGVDAVGMALGFAVILGVAATSGTVIPLLVQRPKGFSTEQAVVTAAALALMLAGVAVCSLAGRWKEGAQTAKPYGRGLAICVASGLLSACGNLGFAFGAEISQRAQSLGAPEHLSGNALWTLLALPLFLCNAGYSVYLLARNRTAARYRAPGSGRMFVLGVLMGAMWMAGMGLYGVGARKLGALGPSLGWAILMSSMVLVANGLGLASGEWKPAPPRSKRQLAFGIAILLAAIAVLGFANRM